MKNEYILRRVNRLARIMTALGFLGAVVAVVLRVWLIPAQRDMETGLFSTNVPVIILMLAIVALLGFCAFLLRGGPRIEIVGRSSYTLALALLAAGVVMVLVGGLETLTRLRVVSFQFISLDVATSPLAVVLQWLEIVFCVLGGLSFVRLAWVLIAENATRRGMAQWSILAPVLWMWLVLANHEMSYAGMVRLTDGFFSLTMYVMQLLFLLCFARYIAGVGHVGMNLLMFCSAGTALFSLSAPLVRIIMYLLQDSEAYAATAAAGVLDLTIGLVALAVCGSMSASVLSYSSPDKKEEEEEETPAWPVAEESSKVELLPMLEEDEVEE